MLEKKTEFLFNILMINEIPFIRIKDNKEFILLDQKVRIATKKANPIIAEQMFKLKYKDYIFKDGMVEPSFLANILEIDWIKRYKGIII